MKVCELHKRVLVSGVGQLSDLDDSISYSQKAVELIDEEPKKPEEGKAEGG